MTDRDRRSGRETQGLTDREREREKARDRETASPEQGGTKRQRVRQIEGRRFRETETDKAIEQGAITTS